ncbi:M48 family metalloprotease [Dyella sp. RRB7]|uniref:M48 family metalloprotease n=1 Tax=Dyella sp. RRB7 TaxID=2919502 RepID=UPI001FA96CAD|nr:M48 family metalloprotease [Dyella sp. RRB7]
MRLTFAGRRPGRWLAPMLWLALWAAGAVAAEVSVPIDSAKAIALGHEMNLYWVVEKSLALLIPAAFLFSGIGARISHACGHLVGGRRYATVALFGGVYALLNALLSLPFNYLRHYRLPFSLGLVHEGPGQWLLGQGVTVVAVMITAALFLWIPYALIRRSPRWWWAWAAAALVPVVLFILVIKPLWVDPLTTVYRPASGAMALQAKALAARCGIPNVTVLVGGDDSTVAGLGPTNRVVLDQDLAKQESMAQIRFTIGHELKHYVLGDNWKALLIISVLLAIGFWLMQRLGQLALARWHARFGFDRVDDPASLPLLVLCMTVLWLAVTPLFLALDRHIEREADRFGLELTHENTAAAQLFAGWVGDAELAEPGRFERIFRDTHPSLGERIRMANSYHPWLTGEPLRYADACAMPGADSR